MSDVFSGMIRERLVDGYVRAGVPEGPASLLKRDNGEGGGLPHVQLGLAAGPPADGGEVRELSVPDARGGAPVTAKQMTEAELMASVKDAARDLGILAFHVPDSRGMLPGLPDLILMGKNGTIWRELKNRYGQLTGAQRLVGYLLQGGGQDWDTWRPADLDSGRIATELEAIA